MALFEAEKYGVKLLFLKNGKRSFGTTTLSDRKI